MTETTHSFLSRCILSIVLLLGLTFSASSIHADAINDLLGGAKATSSEEETSTKVITTDDTRVSDRKIRSRLSEIFAELDTLDKLNIDVNKGVVTLSGEVSSSTVEAKANSLAKKVEGVVEVENEITVTQSVEKRLETTWNKSTALGNKIITALPLLVLAFTVFIIMWFIGRWISRREKLYSYFTKNAFIANLLGQITHLIFIVIGLVLALSLLDATALLGTIMGAAGIFGLAIGFAVRDTVENYIASILLSLRNPFQVKDFVDINGNQGSVARLTSRATILITADGNHLRIPNSEVYKAVIVNFTRNSERRFTFDIGVDAAQDLTEAQQLAVNTLIQIEGVLDDPKPMALIEELGDFNVLLRIYGWVDQDHFSFSKVRSEAIKKSKQAFDDADIIMPEPIYQVRMTDNTSASSTKKKQTIKPATKAKRISDETVDLKPDDTAIDQIEEEFAEGDQQNLLSEQAPNE
ncbi:mechanosensitive ion channel [Cocleimonas sp. KMM 6892]|uniref:mechanosensitive ion channel domain-containing protein n=1 Tax=unclassified Cocleimonas TaxID=2639732 RepID=UPI002DBCA7B8|nr:MULTISPECIES: mechanosensitive ion channel domain-containing protein [unclassified Cocleimonas]MEB8432962.1 mechanosensitive ion channel [Cocleimonas sp. KMM 6892]MEC4716057.1 mechanosensitive ion channel [Cocleimonas sp. KMM 6895]MEC4745518.1 mechanosensitive ion channel [Cocleimonas sp. KMM 6896]